MSIRAWKNFKFVYNPPAGPSIIPPLDLRTVKPGLKFPSFFSAILPLLFYFFCIFMYILPLPCPQ
ncbi:hypothetical protein BACCAP_01679 [Pseudoflavonifractor capillosus ATCC 29799]|uniref:Uncharacterized protein n=1 Tax=Pseudoflavonifractor capillosus ATCC 29799 TaxID=411467 RepID=A6NTZ9_9FIRM|nr:hypothetical protein BACCAP_01679 [Pseudoflavonifractor capillosus ATCC 29799]